MIFLPIWAKMYGIVWCIFPLPPRGPRLCYGDGPVHSSGSCSPPPRDFPVDYLLPRRAMCLDRCGAPAGLKRPPLSQCYLASSPVRVAAFQYHFFISLSFSQVLIYWLVWSCICFPHTSFHLTGTS